MTRIEYEVEYGDKLIIQTYYPNSDTVVFYSFNDIEDACVDIFDIGVWKIKYKSVN